MSDPLAYDGPLPPKAAPRAQPSSGLAAKAKSFKPGRRAAPAVPQQAAAAHQPTAPPPQPVGPPLQTFIPRLNRYVQARVSKNSGEVRLLCVTRAAAAPTASQDS